MINHLFLLIVSKKILDVKEINGGTQIPIYNVIAVFSKLAFEIIQLIGRAQYVTYVRNLKGFFEYISIKNV